MAPKDRDVTKTSTNRAHNKKKQSDTVGSVHSMRPVHEQARCVAFKGDSPPRLAYGKPDAIKRASIRRVIKTREENKVRGGNN